MASVATSSSPAFVQQSFVWDADTNAATTYVAKELSPAINTNAGTTTLARTAQRRLAPKKPSQSAPVTVPTFERTDSVRRGRCEHVGGILVTVLSKYGIGIDDFLAELDKDKDAAR
jgi:hypothetical protein